MIQHHVLWGKQMTRIKEPVSAKYRFFLSFFPSPFLSSIMYAQQQFGTIIQPQTYERSFSPLLVEEEEGWKVSTLPQHVANHQDGHGRNLIHMPSMNSSDCSPTNKRKPLPQVPTLYTAYHWQYDYAQVPCTPMSAVDLDPNAMYHHHYQQQQPYVETSHADYFVSSPSSLSEPEELPSANSSPAIAPSQLQQPKIIERK